MNTNTRAQSRMYNVYRITPFKELWLNYVYGRAIVCFSSRVYACVVVYIFYTALKWKWIKAVHRCCYCCCCCVFVLAVYLSSFFNRYLVCLCLTLLFGLIFFQRSLSLFFSEFHSSFYSHTHKTQYTHWPECRRSNSKKLYDFTKKIPNIKIILVN